MSEGPINQWRAAHKPKRSTSQAQALHLFDTPRNRALCGRKVTAKQIAWPPTGTVTCPDCLAAIATATEAPTDLAG